MLELREIALKQGAEVWIHPLNLRLERGSLTVLLGAALSGKTSLMRLMAGLDRPTSGEIWFDGANVTGVPVRRRKVAMVYQQFVNYPAMTVYENVASPLRLQGKPKAEIDADVRKAAELLRLTPYLGRKPLELSGGQQQRTALARALVKRADLVLMDEPLANLDYKLREELREELPKIFAESGAIFVYATTEPAEALLLGGATAVLDKGRLAQFGPTMAVYRHPRSLDVARAFADPPLNLIQVVKSGGVFLREDGAVFCAVPAHLAQAPEGPCRLAFHPHRLTVAPEGAHPARLDLVVELAEITGSETFLHVDCGPERWTMLAPGVLEIPAGAPLTGWLDPARLMGFVTADDSGGDSAGHALADAAAL